MRQAVAPHLAAGLHPAGALVADRNVTGRPGGLALERDQAGDRRDVASVRRDEAADLRDHAADERDRAAALRDEAADRRDRASDDRDHAAALRDRAAVLRDRSSGGRDLEASRRDSEAERDELVIDLEATDHLAGARLARQLAARDRTQSAQDRLAGATERGLAERDRGTAAEGRGLGAAERTRAEVDRGTAMGDRVASARVRLGSESDRGTAGSDRAASATDRETASFDGLTGVHLRAAGMAQLEHEVTRARRTGSSLVVAFVDVDHLKQVNDARGHAAGDALLVEVAAALTDALRSYDVVLRYGGDEFVCVLPGLRTAAAALRFADMNRGLARLVDPGSVSVGLAELEPDDSAKDLVARADADLYTTRMRIRGAAS